MNCHTCRSTIEVFEVHGNIKGECIICFEKDVDIILFKCGHIICYTCMTELEQRRDNEDTEDIEEEQHDILITELEQRIPKLGNIIDRAMLSIREMTKLKEWIDINQAVYCYELLEQFDEVIEAMQLTELDNLTIEFIRIELSNITDEWIID